MNIGVIGLGYVGLTFSVVAGLKGLNVIALEKSELIKENLKKCKAHFFEPGLDDLLKVLMNRHLFVKESYAKEDIIDIFFITVGTPLLNGSSTPNYAYLESALDAIKNVYDGSQLLILRSTIAVGTTRKLVIPYLAKIAGISETDVLVAFCPERTIEGKAVKELQELPQIIGANNKKALLLAESLFREITNTVVKVDSLEAAELIKLFNNTYRDIHFAVGNVFNEIAQGYNINGVELIQTANLGYERSNIALPGFVGGPCLEKDAYILTENMQDSPGKQFVLNSRKYNESLEEQVIKWVQSHLKSTDKICITGLPFKGRPDTSDLRGSNSIQIVHKLNQLGYLPNLHDFVAYKDEVLDTIKGNWFDDLYDAIGDCQALLILNNHQKYSNLELHKITAALKSENIFILDYWSAMNQIPVKLYPNLTYITAGNILI